VKYNSMLVTAVALAVAGSAWAAEQSGDIEEVVITATKRVSTVQDTSISVTAVSALDIANKGLTDFNSLSQTVPGISMRTSGPGQTEFEMRGLNSAGGNASVVGFYLDETALSSPASAQLGKTVVDPNLYDLSRVEILRGPQGTLYGSSSMGGTVKVVPNAPELGVFTASGETVLSDTGSGGGTNFAQNGMVNLPLGSDVALRLVGSSSSDSGWLKRFVFADGAVPTDTATGTRPPGFYTAPLQETVSQANSTSLDSFRATVLWRPADGVSITPAFMWQHTRQDAPNAVDVDGTPANPQVPSENVAGHWEIYDTPEPQDDQFTLGSLKVEWQTENVLITSATGVWRRLTVVSQDGTEENAGPQGLGFPGPYDTSAGGPGPVGPGPTGPGVQERDATSQLSEELRVTSTDKGPFQWQAGYYYQRLNSDWDMWSINTQILSEGIGNVYVDYMPQTITQNALFGEASLEFAQGWKATVGLRGYHYEYTQSNTEWGDFTPFGFANLDDPTLAGNTMPFNTASSGSASGINPKFDLSWKVNPQQLLYVTAARGFRMGGTDQPFTGYLTDVSAAICGAAPTSLAVILQCGLQQKLSATATNPGGYFTPNAQFPNANAQGVPQFKSDSVWNYEVGEKGEFFDRQLTLNVDGYYERWNNPQLATNVGGFGYSVNGANASIVGAEVELWLKLPAGFSFAGNLGYSDSKFLSDSPITGYLSGTAVPDSPKVTSSVTLRNVQPLAGGLQLNSSLSYNYIGERTNAPYGETITLFNMNQDLVHLPAYGLLNLRTGVKSDDWTVSLFANNLANKETLLDTQPQINLQTAAFTRYIVNQPRTIGLDVSYSFGH
jgi:iron complex outermembrane recepter protein